MAYPAKAGQAKKLKDSAVIVLRRYAMAKQYNHILVPLDNSKLAELALPDALTLAQLNKATITLLHVIPPSHLPTADYPVTPVLIDQFIEDQRKWAQGYLDEVRNRLRSEGVTIQTAVEVGLAAETIIDYAAEYHVDLIVMSTHGRSGLQRWVYGSVADKVLRGAHVPVVLVRAHQPKQALAA
jgi:nucleotide-binding universal stress UspA family protein